MVNINTFFLAVPNLGGLLITMSLSVLMKRGVELSSFGVAKELRRGS